MQYKRVHSFPRIVFVGAHMEAYAPLRRLVEDGENIESLVTLGPEYLSTVAGSVDLTSLAERAGIPTLRVRNINQPDAIAWIRERAPDVLLVVGWTQLLRQELLRIARVACLGFHASLLPKYRGRAPVNWAIINGESVTGNTMITLEPEADTGDIVAQRMIPITDEDTCRTVYEKVGATEVEMLADVLPLIRNGVLPRRKQDDSQATVMPKRRPENGLINWSRSTRDIYNWVRALTDPYPGAFSFVNGRKLFIWVAQEFRHPTLDISPKPGEVSLDAQGWPCAATADGCIRLVRVQREGGPIISGQDASLTFLRSGTTLGGAQESVN